MNRKQYLAFFLVYFAAAFGMGYTGQAYGPESGAATFSSILFLAAWVSMITAAVMRLQHIGYSGWLVLLSFVPIANLWVFLVCLFRKGGFVEERAQAKAEKAQRVAGELLAS